MLGNLNRGLVAIDLDPSDPAAGAHRAFELDYGAAQRVWASDCRGVSGKQACSLRGELTTFAPVELLRRTPNSEVRTFGVVDLDRGELVHEGRPFPDSTVVVFDSSRVPRHEGLITVNAHWFDESERQTHVGIFDGTTGTFVAGWSQQGLRTQAAAIEPDRIWLWVERFSPAVPIFAYSGAFQPIPSKAGTDTPQPSHVLAAVFGLAEEI